MISSCGLRSRQPGDYGPCMQTPVSTPMWTEHVPSIDLVRWLYAMRRRRQIYEECRGAFLRVQALIPFSSSVRAAALHSVNNALKWVPRIEEKWRVSVGVATQIICQSPTLKDCNTSTRFTPSCFAIPGARAFSRSYGRSRFTPLHGEPASCCCNRHNEP